jgi:hypothetical protein
MPGSIAVVRDIYTTPVSSVASVTTSRRRAGVMYHRINVAGASAARRAAPFAGQLSYAGDTFEFARIAGLASKEVGLARLGGDELIGVRLHLRR